MDGIVAASKQYLSPYKAAIKNLGLSTAAPYRSEYEKLYAEAPTVLSALSRKYKLGILANQSDGLVERLRQFGIADHFDTVISSFDYKISKPDIRLFEIAIEKAGCRAQNILMAGDRLDNDIFPAKAVGMKTAWIKQGFGGMQAPMTEQHAPDVEVDSLSDLLKIL